MTVVVLMAVACATGAAQVAERKVDVAMSDLPAAIKQAVREAFPQGKILAVQKEVEGEDPGQYDIEVQSEGKVYEVEVSPAGVVIEAKAVREVGADGGRKTKDEGRGTGETPVAREGKTPSPRGDEGRKTKDEGMKWTSDFGIEARKFATTGKNRFFILQPGYRIVLESKTDKVVITVLDQTRRIGNVLTRVVEERESEDGQLVEVSRNFFAICTATGDVFYFGEEVDDYKDGKVVGHGGAWRADEKGSKAGIIMPGTVLQGARHYQEMAPNAMDRAEVIADDVTMKTPAGTFKNCIRVKETSPLEPGDICYKTYAPGIGLIQDEDLLLTAYIKGGEHAEKEDQPVKKQAAREKATKKGGPSVKKVVKEGQPVKKQMVAGKAAVGKERPTVKKQAGGEKAAAPALKDLPKAVRQAAVKWADGGRITEVEKKQTDDGVVYEIEVTAEGGRQRDILISPEGKYLGMESDEQDKGDEKGKSKRAAAADEDEDEGDDEEDGDDEEEGDDEGDDDDADDDGEDEEGDDEDADDEEGDDEEADNDDEGDDEGDDEEDADDEESDADDDEEGDDEDADDGEDEGDEEGDER